MSPKSGTPLCNKQPLPHLGEVAIPCPNETLLLVPCIGRLRACMRVCAHVRTHVRTAKCSLHLVWQAVPQLIAKWGGSAGTGSLARQPPILGMAVMMLFVNLAVNSSRQPSGGVDRWNPGPRAFRSSPHPRRGSHVALQGSFRLCFSSHSDGDRYSTSGMNFRASRAWTGPSLRAKSSPAPRSKNLSHYVKAVKLFKGGLSGHSP